MKRAEVLLSLAGIVMGTAYVTGNPAVALIGTAIIAHYSLARDSFKPSLRATRELPRTCVEGEPVKTTVVIENTGKTKGTVTVRDSSDKVLSRDVRTDVGPSEKKRIIKEIVPISKGRIELTSKAIFTDEMGLFRAEFNVEGDRELTVFPSQKSMLMALKERRVVNALSEAQKALGIGIETSEFEELREFLPGDNVRRMDWKATSRLQKPVVRVFKRETLSEICILVNTDPAFRRELLVNRLDYLVLILAQLVTYFKRFGHTIRVVTYDEKGAVRSIERHRGAQDILQRLELKGERGVPPLRPSRMGKTSSLHRKISRIRGGLRSSGLLKAVMTLPPNSYVIIIDDIGLHPAEIVKASEMLSRKGARSVVLYPNPVLFLKRDALSPENLRSLYLAYRERKELLRKLRSRVNIIEVGPKDVLPRLVRRL